MPKRLTTADFIERANKIHDYLYDYSYVVYTNMHTKVKIIDHQYGEFWQTPIGHINEKQGHPLRGRIKAGMSRRMGLKKFIKLSKDRFGDLYDYSKVEYSNCDTKVCIIDPEFGEFWQSPYQHLRSHGCPARTAAGKNLIDMDHIIPLSIIHSRKRKFSSWTKNRPLFKLLDSEINLRPITAKFNKDKSDTITINNKTIDASSVRNHYEVIGILIRSELGIDPTQVIEDDKLYVNQYLGLI